MGAGRFVGRVGALAVALGVGAAVSSGTAWADDAAGGSPNSAGAASGSNDSAGATSGSNSASGSDAGGDTADSTGVSDSAAGSSEEDAGGGTPSSVDESTEQDPDESAADPDASTDSTPEVRDDSTEQEDTSPAPTRTSTDEPSTSHDRTERSSDTEEVAEPASVEADHSSGRSSTASETESDSSAADSEATAEAATVAAPQAVVLDTIAPTPLAAPVTDTADSVAAAADSADEPTASTAELAGAVAASLLDTGVPGDVPVDTPAEWVLLAAARRELADPEDSGTSSIESVVPQSLLTTAAPDPLGDILTGAFQTITGILSTAVSVADGTITGALGLIGGTIDLAATATSVVLNTAINVVNWGITTTANLITGALATAVNALADAFDSSPTPLGDAIAGTLTFLTNVVTTTVNVLTQASTGVLTFTATGLSTAVTLLSDTVVGTLNLATQAVDLALQTINTILNPNSAPVAADDVVSTAEDAAVLIAAATLLANDTDPDDDVLSISAITQAAHGTTSKAANGDITYTPNTNFNGTDTFTYTTTDGTETSTATVTVTVTPVNDAPVGVNDTASTTEDNPVTITLNTLLANDSDPEDDPFSITAVGQGTRGTTGRVANGDIIYTPGLNVSGTDTFTYTISDGDKSSTATVTVTITPTNDAPIAGTDTATTAEDTPKTITANTLLANDSDPDHDALSITTAGQGIHGTTSKAANGDITYSPNANFNGTDTFTYTITDGAKTSTATVTVTVTPVNDAPVGINDTASTTQGLAVTLAANTLLANDTDVDTAHNALSITAATQGAHGTTSRAANGDITYTPNATFAGTDTFTYTVSDGALSSTATVTVTVTGTTPIEHSPVANNDNATTDEDTPKTITANTLLANDSDADNDPLSITAAGQGAHGTTSRAANGDITYTPNANFNGTDTFTYTVSDGTLTNTATVTVTITPVNDAPSNGTSNPGSPNASTGVVTGTVSATDVDGDTLTYSAPATTDKGSITMVGNTFTYTPTAAARQAAGADGATDTDKHDTFTVTASDGHGKTLAIPVTVAIAAPVVDNGADAIAGLWTSATQPKFNITKNGSVYNWTVAEDFQYIPAGTVWATMVNTATKNYAGSVTQEAWDLTATHIQESVDQMISSGTTDFEYMQPVSDSFTVTLSDDEQSFTMIDHEVIRTYTVANGVVVGSEDVDQAPVTATYTRSAGATDTNHDPTFDATQTSPDTDENGVVTGQLVAHDVDAGDTLTYSVTTDGAYGHAVIDPHTGQYTYTPNAGDSTDALAGTWGVPGYPAFGITKTGTTTYALSYATAVPLGAAFPAGTAIATLTQTETGTYSGSAYPSMIALVNSSLDDNPDPSSILESATFTFVLNEDQSTATVTLDQEYGGGSSEIDEAVLAKLSSSTVVADSFVVTVTDSHGATDTHTVSTTPSDTGTGTGSVHLGDQVALAGKTFTVTKISKDGSRAIAIMKDTKITTVTVDDYSYNEYKPLTRFAVLNTATGAQVGSTLTLDGELDTPQTYGQAGAFFTDDSTRVLLVAFQADAYQYPEVYTTRVAVLNAGNGAQVGSTREYSTEGDFAQFATIDFSAAGKRALVNVTTYSEDDNDFSTRFELIDVSTNTLLNTFPLAHAGTAVLDAAGTHLILAESYTTTTTHTDVTFVNAGTGATINTLTFDGNGAYPLVANTPYWIRSVFTNDGTRAIVALMVDNSSTLTTRFVELNTVTGTQIGSGVTMGTTDDRPSIVGFNAAGTKAIVAVWDAASADNSTVYAVMDLATGTRIGTPIPLSGVNYGTPVFNAAGTTATVTAKYIAAGASTVSSHSLIIDLATGSATPVTV